MGKIPASRVRIPPSPLRARGCAARRSLSRGKPCFPRAPPSSWLRFCDPFFASHRGKLGSGGETFAHRGFKNQRIPCRLAARLPRRGGRAVECGGLENRFGRFRPTRVQIPPPPPFILRDGLPNVGGAGLVPAGAEVPAATALRQEGAHGGNPVSPVLECGGLENRFGRFRPTRVQIPPPPPN